jgi:hypothetical protein
MFFITTRSEITCNQDKSVTQTQTHTHPSHSQTSCLLTATFVVMIGK